MIKIGNNTKHQNIVKYVFSGSSAENTASCGLPEAFDAVYLKTFPLFGAEERVLYIGLGEAQKLERKMCKELLAKAVKQMSGFGYTEIGIDLTPLVEKFGQDCLYDVTEGIVLGMYTPKSYKSENKEKEYTVTLYGIDPSAAGEAESLIQQAQNIAEAVMFARDLVNEPANMLTPEKMADVVSGAEGIEGLTVQVLDEKEISALSMNSFLTVANSSTNPPRLIVLRYMGNPQSNEVTALVGKGITCDTGGYCIKSAASMRGIKGDMAGGAAVAGALRALAKNKAKVNAVGIIPACENRISPDSFIPGDVVVSMSGKTIEILNTDAEGRLILADAVTYAIRQEKATRICDVATLTGAVVNMLGFTIAGAFSNDESFWQSFELAGKVSGEQYWRLPLYDEHRKMIESKIADVKNVGESYSGTIAAAAFIEAFTESKPWIHLDIAGTAWVDKPAYEYQAAGATGAALTTMYFLLDDKIAQ